MRTTLWSALLLITGCCLLAEGTPQLTYHRPAQKGKNWCAYIVNKNVSCTVMEGTESFIQPQYKCSWNQNQCQPTLAYRVSFRPRYVTSYKVVTELEWRCCPGFKGHDCNDGPADKAKQTVVQTPRPSGNKKETEPHGQQQKLEPKTDFQELNEAREKKIQTLEEEVLRLTQTVIDLQTSVSGVNENLKITVQEDVSKFLNSWLNNLAPTASATGSKTEYYLPGLYGSAEKDDGIKDVVSELTSAREELQNKSEQIEELNKKINLYEERLIELEELSRESTSTVSSTSVQKEVDDKIEALRNEMLEGMDRKMADLKNSCEYKLINIQQQCEENEDGCSGVKEMVLEKESELRKEIMKLSSQIQTGTNGNSGCCKNNDFDTALKDLDLKVEKIAEAHRVLNVRLDNEVQRFNILHPDQSWNEKLIDLEFKINVTEKNAEEHCFYIEDSLRGLINTSLEDMKSFIVQRFQVVEARLKTALFIKNGHLSNTDESSDSLQVLVQTQLDNSLLLKSITDTMNERFEQLQNKTSDLEDLKAELASVKFDLYRIEDSVNLLNENFGSFKDQLQNLNSTVRNTQRILSLKVDDVTKRLKSTSDAPVSSECCNDLQSKFEVLKRDLTTDKEKCPDNAQGVRKDISAVDARVSKLENVCGKLDTISGSLQRIKDGLNKHVTSLWNCLHNINGTIRSHSRDIYGLKNSVQVFQTQVTQITSDLQDLIKSEPGAGAEPKLTPQVEVLPPPPPRERVPQQPVIPQMPVIPSHSDLPEGPVKPLQPQLPQKPTYTEPKSPSPEPEEPSPTGSVVIPLVPGRNGILIQGEAGAPGRMIIQTGSGRPKGGMEKDLGKDMEQSKGFAGAPGYPKPDKEDEEHVTVGPFSESKGSTATSAATIALISFSVGLGKQPNVIDLGLIPFNIVLVNDGDHYNPVTGVFTAPIEGRYLITAVLTPEREHHVEAVLSVSNVSVAQLDTSGYRKEILEYHRPSSRRQICGGVGTFNLVLHLKAGDEVSIVLTGGTLANTDSDEMYSTFSGIFLYPTSFQR
ncbi:EMILIN-2 [Gastrophryne carolinensis]